MEISVNYDPGSDHVFYDVLSKKTKKSDGENYLSRPIFKNENQ